MSVPPGLERSIRAWAVLGGVWALSAGASGLLLALVARRLHRGLSLVRLWAFYSALTAFLVAVVLLVGLF